MHIRLATEIDIEPLTVLFNLYRQSLGQASQLANCRQFISNRLSESDTMIFIATDEQQPLGFLQLYPSYSTLLLKPIWYFDDVYVVEAYRGEGIAKQLIQKAKSLADSTEVMIVKRTLMTNGSMTLLSEMLVAQEAEHCAGSSPELTHELTPELTQELTPEPAPHASLYIYHQAL
jgi:GNAT superfamily N-acetyltransferase